MAYQSTGGARTDTFISTASAAAAIVTDPYLGEVANLVLKLQELEGKTGSPGIGLRSAVKPLKLAVYAKKNPWFLPTVATSIVAGIFLLGYSTGRVQRRRRA